MNEHQKQDLIGLTVVGVGLLIIAILIVMEMTRIS